MIISPAKTPPAALPPSIAGGSNAPSNRQQPDAGFASLISQLSGGGVDPSSQAQTDASAGTGRKRTAAAEDLPQDAGDDAGDPTAATAVAVPAWLWALPIQPSPVDTAPAGQSATGTPVASSDASTTPVDAKSDDGDTARSSATIVDLSPATTLVSLTGAVDRTAPGQASDSPARASGAYAGAAATQADGGEPQNTVAALDPQRPGLAANQPLRNGAASSGILDEPGLAANAHAERASLRSIAAGNTAARALSSDSTAPSARSGDSVRTGDRQATPGAARGANANLAAPAAATQPAFAFDPAASAVQNGSAQDGTSKNETGQESARSFADGRGLADEALASASPVLEANVAAALHPGHASVLTTGQAGEASHASSVDKAATLGSAVPSAAVSADRTATIDDANLHRQIVQAIQLQSRNGIGDARLTLQPEYLGEVKIALHVEAGAVTAHVNAATAEVRSWLSAHEALLRQGLAEKGLTLDRLIVSDEPAESPRESKDGDTRRQQQPQQEEQPRRRPRSNAGTFEITV